MNTRSQYALAGEDRWRDLHSSVQSFFERAWDDLARYGVLVHEVAPERPVLAEGLGLPDAFRLIRVDSRTIVQRRGRLVQVTSAESRARFGLPPHVPLDSPRFVTFRLPPDLEQPVRAALSGLSGTDFPSMLLALPGGERGLPHTPGYHFSDHVETRDALIARATREIGWSGRGQFNKDVSRYYLVARRLRFGAYVARLRQVLLGHLNAGLRLGGALVGVEFGLEQRWPPLPIEFVFAERAIREGRATFREVLSGLGL